MVALCLYFQVHQPYRFKEHSVFDIGKGNDIFDDDYRENTNNKDLLKKVCNKCYIPANKILLELLEKNPDFKISFSFSGIVLEQLEKNQPEVLESFKKLVDTGQVEILSETYYHSLAFLYSVGEFRQQVRKHTGIVKRIFGVIPRIFRNTELIYSNAVAREAELMGFRGILSEGVDSVLGWRSPNYLYRPANTTRIKLLLKNYRLSDDIAFRFSEKTWDGWPLTASKYVSWLNGIDKREKVVNLFMDFETFGEHQWEESGIFDFLKYFPQEFLKHNGNKFMTPSEVVDSFATIATCDVPNFTSWADLERDLSAWLGNEMQSSAIKKVYSLGHDVLSTRNEELIDKWRKLQTSDHYYYMCTKYFSDGAVHKYFSPYKTPYEAFINFMNVIYDLELEIKKVLGRGTVEAIKATS